jgi:uncharacterized protein (DUF1697 family)
MRWAALLRGVNVGGRKLLMSDLAAFARDLGFTEVRTLLASGNLLFESEEGDAAVLEALLERESAARLGLITGYHLRSADDLRRTIAANPFPHQAATAPNHLFVHFHREPVPDAWVAAVRAEHVGPEEIAADGRELFVDLKDRAAAGPNGSTLPVLIGKKRFARVNTARNWNTVGKLLAALDQ